MLGVISSDQTVAAVAEYFGSVPYENVFIVDKLNTLICEIDQFYWRRFLVEHANPALPLLDAIRLFEARGRKRRLETAKAAAQSGRLSRLVPTLDLNRRVQSVAVAGPVATRPQEAYGLIMAGGFGRRLGEMTKTVPKPMLPVAGKPIAEHLVDNLVDNGVGDLFMSLHYLGDVVKSHFGDGGAFGCRIRYLEESTPLGTAGCLSLIGEPLDKPLLVINGDVVTNLQVSRLLDYHERSGADVTMAVRRHTVAIPYGVVEHGAGAVLSIREKPRLTYDINVAIYVLSPNVLRHVATGVKADMPDFIQSLLPMGYRVHVFPMFENWIDVGSVADMTRARDTYDPSARPSLNGTSFLPSSNSQADEWSAVTPIAAAL